MSEYMDKWAEKPASEYKSLSQERIDKLSDDAHELIASAKSGAQNHGCLHDTTSERRVLENIRDAGRKRSDNIR